MAVNLDNTVDLILTPCTRGHLSKYRIEMAHNCCQGVKPRRHTPPPIREVIINKQVLKLPEVDSPGDSLTFVANMSPNQTLKEPYRESREVNFWFLAEVPDRLRANLAMDYFRRLIQEESFPKDKAQFVHRAMLLLQYFPAFRMVELVIQPAPPAEDEIESEEEEEVCVKRFSRDIDSEDEEPPMENFITVLTPAVYDYQYLPEVNVTQKTHVTFRVRAKANAHIALSSVYGDTVTKTYEILIGGWDNMKSAIRNGGNGPVIKETMTPNILNDEDLLPFWISWSKNIVEVGQGNRKGTNRVLRWKVPKSKQHSVNCMSVSTGEGATGEWEFVEYIAPVAEAATTAEGRRQVIRMALMKEAKKRQLLIALEQAFPFTLNMEQLLRMAEVPQSAMMEAVAILKEAEESSLVVEVAKGIWMRSPRSKMDRGHDIQLLKVASVSMTTPTIAIFTALYCEKLAVDSMMESKVSYIQYANDNARSITQVYTVGVINGQHVVSLKLSEQGDIIKNINACDVKEAVGKIFGLFTNIQHVISVGVAGAVPHFTDYSRHVRLGDVVVSYPVKPHQVSYLYCEGISKSGNPGTYDYSARAWRSDDGPMVSSLKQLNSGFQTDSLVTSTIEKYIGDGQRLLKNEDGILFDRPGPRTDKLYMEDEDGEKVLIEHPKPTGLGSRLLREGQPRIHYGVPAGGKYVACDYQMRLEFADENEALCFDKDSHSLLEAVEDHGKTSYVIIRGMGDYIDGRRNLDWQPYAALSAAAYMKLMLRHFQPGYRRYY